MSIIISDRAPRTDKLGSNWVKDLAVYTEHKFDVLPAYVLLKQLPRTRCVHSKPLASQQLESFSFFLGGGVWFGDRMVVVSSFGAFSAPFQNFPVLL